MWSLNYSSISSIQKVLEGNGLAMTKKFGQNFLISEDCRVRIVQAMDLEKGMKVWEVGPGLGAITHLLFDKGASVTAFEIDHGFASVLREKAFADEDFTLVEGDALKTLFERPLDAERIIGNLPYNVGSQIIARLIENGYLPPLMVFTLQREVADRMRALPGDPDYSSFSVLTQLDYVNTMPLVIKAGSFFPAPRVDSAVIVMKRKENILPMEERRVLLPLVRALFAQRRKTIKNNLSSTPFASKMDDAFTACSLTGKERAETLSLEKLIQLARAIS